MSDQYNLAGKTLLVDSIKEVGSRKQTVEETAGKITRISDAIYTEKNYGAVVAQIESIASDNLLTPNERESVQREWNSIISTYVSLTAQATEYGITTQTVYQNYLTSYTALSTYLTGGTDPILPNDGELIVIVGSTMKTKFSDYFTKEGLLSVELFQYTTGLLDGLDDRTKVSLKLLSSTGIALSNGATTLSAHIYVDNTEVTSTTDPDHQYLGGDLNPYDFEWTRVESGWSRSQSDRRSAAISITESDLSNGSGTFYCVYKHYYATSLYYQQNSFITVEKTVVGQASFKSIVFLRSNSTPTTPTGGSYSSPIPTSSPTWSDGVPSGTSILWMTTRIFTSDGESPQESTWTTPSQTTDTASIDFQWSAVTTSPSDPTTTPANWHSTATSSDIWMATRTCINGVWGSWNISKIKGEKGDKGDQGTGVSIKADESSCTAIGDAYIIQDTTSADYGHLMILTSLSPRTFTDGGEIKGPKGDQGDPGTSATQYYYHIVYCNNTSTGEGYSTTPANNVYQGSYTDTESADASTWAIASGKTIKWNYVKGTDGDSYSLFITSSNGSSFRSTNINTTLSCYVFQNNTDITATLSDSAFNWKRNSGHTTEDEQWNTSSKALGHKTVQITTSDCIGRTVFSCEVDL